VPNDACRTICTVPGKQNILDFTVIPYTYLMVHCKKRNTENSRHRTKTSFVMYCTVLSMKPNTYIVFVCVGKKGADCRVIQRDGVDSHKSLTCQRQM
jgi:hypothetical protein